MITKVKRIVFWLTVAVAAAAVIEQLRRPRALRTWHGSILGVPYDFRKPTLERISGSWWNPDDDRLFMPRAFGVGWDVNLHRLASLATGRYEEPSPEADTAG